MTRTSALIRYALVAVAAIVVGVAIGYGIPSASSASTVPSAPTASSAPTAPAADGVPGPCLTALAGADDLLDATRALVSHLADGSIDAAASDTDVVSAGVAPYIAARNACRALR